MMAKWNEYQAQQKYEEEGYDVIHSGVPDLLLFKDGKIRFVEIKTPKDKLNDNQVRAFKILEKHGFDVRIERVSFAAKSKGFIDMKEQREIVQRYKDDNITLAELYNLISRAQSYEGMSLFARLLISFYNEMNSEMGTLKSKLWKDKHPP